MHDEYRLSAEQISKLLHDLRAPVANAKGFRSELDEAVVELTATIDNMGSELSDQNRQSLTDIITQDITVCTELLSASVDKLNERVQEFERLFPMTGN